MDIVRFIRILVKRKRLLMIAPLLAAAVVFLLTLNSARVYKSQAQLASGILDDTKISFEDKSDLLSTFVTQSKFSNLIELIKSRQNIDLLSYRLLLHDLENESPLRKPSKMLMEMNPEAKANVIRILKEKLSAFSGVNYASKDEAGVSRLIKSCGYDSESILKKLKVERVGNSDFLLIAFEAETAELAAFGPNTICDEFIQYYRTIKNLQGNSSIDFFEKLAREKKAELDKLVSELQDYKQKNKIINLYEQTKSLVNQISALELTRESENKSIPSLRGAIKEIDSKFSAQQKGFLEVKLQPYHVKIESLKQLITDINDRYIASNFSDFKLRDSLSLIRGQLQGEIKNISDNFILDPDVPLRELVTKKINYELDLQIAQKGVESMDRERQRLQNIIDKFTPSEATISSFDREINVLVEAYLVILNKLNLAKFSTDAVGMNIKQIEYALPPESPEASKRALLVIMSALITLIVLVVMIFVMEYLDLSIKTPRQFVQISKLNLLGYLSYLDNKELNFSNLFNTTDMPPNQLVFRDLLKNLRHSIGVALGDGKLLLITGNTKGEGKSLVIIALVYAARLLGKKILVIDANQYNNYLTRQFNAAPTFEKWIGGELNLDSAISSTSLSNVDIIGCGVSASSPMELATKESLSDKFNSVRALYDLVFIEGPSITKYPNSKELLEFVDKAAVVFEANKTFDTSDKEAAMYMTGLNEKFIGAILNKVSIDNLENSYGEVTKQRSKFRISVKKLLKRNLSKSEV